MQEIGFERIKDSGEESSFVGRFWPEQYRPIDVPKTGNSTPFARPVLVTVYSDNFLVSGLFREAVAVHKLLMKYFGCSEELNYHLTDIVGLERSVGVLNGRKAVLLHQEQYARHLVAEYEERFCGGKPLRGDDTALVLRESEEYGSAPAGTPYTFIRVVRSNCTAAVSLSLIHI